MFVELVPRFVQFNFPISVVLIHFANSSTKNLTCFFLCSLGNSSAASESEPNNSQNSAVSFDTESDQMCRSSPSSFTWVGQTSRRFQLDSNGTLPLKFNALISLPGVYNVNNLRVLARIRDDHQSGGAMIPQKPCPPSYIVVENTFTNLNDLG